MKLYCFNLKMERENFWFIEKLNPPFPLVPGPCDPEDLIDGIIFAANYLGSTQLLSDKTPSKNIRMMQAQEAVSRIKVKVHSKHIIRFQQMAHVFLQVLLKFLMCQTVRQLHFGF